MMEWFAPPEQRIRMRRLRQQRQAVNRKAEELVRSGGRENPDKLFVALENLLTTHGDARPLARLRECRQSIREIREEIEELHAIRERSEGALQTEIGGYREYLVAHPESRVAHQFLAGALERSGEFEESIELHRNAVRLADSKVAEEASRVALARGLARAGRPGEGIAELESLIQSNPERVNLCGAYFELGNIREQTGDESFARAAWKQAVRLDQTGVFRKHLREKGKKL